MVVHKVVSGLTIYVVLQILMAWEAHVCDCSAQISSYEDIYEEADVNKRRKNYARPLIDLHMKIYRYEERAPESPEEHYKR
ncbi:hypothetical protein Dimus_026160 [Dionaea muscipula]